MQSNILSVKAQIELMKSGGPFHATKNYVKTVVTDYDTVPYPRWYRGQVQSDVPIVAEREAGWRPQRNNCYKLKCKPPDEEYPNHCFEAACSTVFPCYPQYLQKFSDRKQMNIILNKACITQNR